MATLIQAFAKIVKSESSFRLIILGDGPEKSRLENLSRERGIPDFIQCGRKTSFFRKRTICGLSKSRHALRREKKILSFEEYHNILDLSEQKPTYRRDYGM